MSDNLADLIASKMIARPDVKAIQRSDGSYNPIRTRWTRADIHDHLSGEKTYGHYLLDTDDTVKMFCFDVDFEDNVNTLLPSVPDWVERLEADEDDADVWEDCNPREVWRDRRDWRRSYLKVKMRTAANELCRVAWEQLEIPVAAAYSGNKGFHVYGFTGRMSAGDAREGAMIVLEEMGKFVPSRGDNFFSLKPENETKVGNDTWYEYDREDPFYPFVIEVFPKQSTLAGKDLGNLLRLPLGRNQKSKDPTFFMDLTAPLTEMIPVDPEWALTTTDPWKRPGE